MKIPSITEMLQAGVHFGHQTSRWHPKMNQYIFTVRNSIHIINLEKTQEELEKTAARVKQMASEGKTILFVTTKPQARDLVKQAAIACGAPYLVERWLGGLLTNFSEMRKLIKSYIDLKEQQKNGELEKYTKKEQLEIAKDLAKKDETLIGLVGVDRMPDAIFVPSLHNEKTAVTEANKTGVTIIGISDTNANPLKAEYVIPGNDDATKSIAMIVNVIAEAVKEGKEEFEKKKLEAANQK